MTAGESKASRSQRDITALLDAAASCTPNAIAELLQAVYAELRATALAKMAHETPGHTLQPTALVHEAWLRLDREQQRWENRAHFFSAAAEAMRRILVESARRKQAARHGGGHRRISSDEVEIAIEPPADELLAVHEALDEFGRRDSQKAELVKLRYFVGLSIEEAAAILGISPRTAKRHWTFAKAWLADAIKRARSG